MGVSCVQALARGFLGRCEFRRRLAAQRAREAAALRVIAPWGRTALHRCRFLALRWVLPCTLAVRSSPNFNRPKICA